MHIENFPVGAFGVNCLIVWENPAQAVVVDPGAEADLIQSTLSKHGLSISAYWLTHGHIDHISAIGKMVRSHPAPVYIHEADSNWAFSALNVFPPYFKAPARPDNLVFLAEGPLPPACGVKAEVIHTPGHTPGGVCFHLPGQSLLISGDTLFQGSVGRTDLPGGDMATLEKSLAKLMTLPDALRVIPGHGPETTIGGERRANPFIRGGHI